VETGRSLKSLGVLQPVSGPWVAFTRKTSLCAITEREDVKLYDLSNLTPLEHEFPAGGQGEPSAVACHPDGTIVAFAVAGVIRLGEIATGFVYEPFEKHSKDVASLAFTLDGKTLISGGRGRIVREWLVPDLK
jgi:WD40 repeat protein